MDEFRGENKILLRGQAAAPPALSHRNHGVDYYVTPLRVPRLSGVDDVLNLVTAAQIGRASGRERVSHQV